MSTFSEKQISALLFTLSRLRTIVSRVRCPPLKSKSPTAFSRLTGNRPFAMRKVYGEIEACIAIEEIRVANTEVHRPVTLPLGKRGITRRVWLSVMGSLGALWLGKQVSAKEAEAELHLVLAFDVSASVNDQEFRLQSAGTAMALRDPTVLSAIEGAPGGIAISIVQWSSSTRQAIALGWARLGTRRSVIEFSHLVEAMSREISGGNTMIHAGLAFAARQFDSAPGIARRRVIDVSGNGPTDDDDLLVAERQRLIEKGIIINALAIEELKGNLTRYYEEFLIGGSGAFVQTAPDFSDYEQAMRRKLLREIVGLPLS